MAEIQIINIYEIRPGKIHSMRYPEISVELDKPIRVRDGEGFGLLDLNLGIWIALQNCQERSTKEKILKRKDIFNFGSEGCKHCEHKDRCFLRRTYNILEKINEGDL